MAANQKYLEVLDSVRNENTLIGSLRAVVEGLHAQLADAMTRIGLDPEERQALDAILEQSKANIAALTDAVTANTPVEGTPTDQPPDGTSSGGENTGADSNTGDGTGEVDTGAGGTGDVGGVVTQTGETDTGDATDTSTDSNRTIAGTRAFRAPGT